MPIRQQLLFLWLAEGALDTGTIAWAFHDGCEGRGPGLPEGEPPYETGVTALGDGWCLLQAPAPQALMPGTEHAPGPLLNEFVFERRIALADEDA
jgi:hypothetical protein